MRQSFFGQLVRYAIVGALGTAFDFLLLWLLLRTSLPVPAAVTVAYGVATLGQFFLNRSWTFEAFERPVESQLATYILVTIVNWLLALVFVEIGTGALGIGPIAAKALSIPPSALVGFLGNRHITFRRSRNK